MKSYSLKTSFSKKLLLIVLIGLLLIGVMSTLFISSFMDNAKGEVENTSAQLTDVWDGTSDTSWYDAANPLEEYTFITAEQVAGFAALVNGGNDFTYTNPVTNETKATIIKFGANFDLNGKDGEEWILSSENGLDVTAEGYDESTVSLNVLNAWTPIGYKTTGDSPKLNANIDGQNHTISNMAVVDNVPGLGFIGQTYGGIFSVENLNFEDCYVLCQYSSTNDDYVGIVMGYGGYYYESPAIVLRNINVNNSIVRGNHSIGIIAGFSNGVILENCLVTNSTIDRSVETVTQVGCIAGNWTTGNADMSYVEMVNCGVLNSVINIDKEKASYYGLFAGVKYNSSGTNIVKGCYSDQDSSIWFENASKPYTIIAAKKTYSNIFLDDNVVLDCYDDEVDGDYTIKYQTAELISKLEVALLGTPTEMAIEVNNVAISESDYSLQENKLIIALDEAIGNVVKIKITINGNTETIYVVTEYITKESRFLLDGEEIENHPLTIKTVSGTSYVKAGESNVNELNLSLGFTDGLDENTSARAVIETIEYNSEGEELVLGKLNGKLVVEIYYTYKGVEVSLGSKTVYLGLIQYQDDIYMLGDWEADYIEGIGEVLKSKPYDPIEGEAGQTGVLSTMSMFVFNSNELQFEAAAYGNGTFSDKVGIEGAGSGTIYSYSKEFADESAILAEHFESNYKKYSFSNSEVNELTITYTKGSTPDTKRLYGGYLRNIGCKKIILDDKSATLQASTNGALHDIEVTNNDVVDFNFLNSNSLILTAPILGIGETCALEVDGEIISDSLEIDQGVYFYNLGSIYNNATIKFLYSSPTYVNNEFVVNVIFNIGDTTIEEGLIKETTAPIEIINDETYPYVFSGESATADKLAFRAGNKGVRYSKSYIGLKFTKTGVLYFDYFISCNGYSSVAFWSIGGKATSPNNNSELTATAEVTQFGYLNSGELISYSSSVSKAEACGDLGWLSAHIAIEIPEGKEDVILYFAYGNYVSTFLDTFALANLCFYEGTANIGYTISDQEGGSLPEGECSVTIKSGESTLDNGASVSNGSSVTYTATANTGYTFYGWVEDGVLLGIEEELTVNIVRSRNITAIFAQDIAEGIGKYAVRNDATFYDNLTSALEAAVPGDTLIVLRDFEISSSVTIPSGVTLLLPYSKNDTAGTKIGDVTNAQASVSWSTDESKEKYHYLTITILSGGELNIVGELIVGAIQHYPDQSAQGHTSGAYSEIINNGLITVKANGKLYNYGLISGTGTLVNELGAQTYTPFIVNNYSGGSNTSDLYSANQFPFTQFATINITCKQTVNYGAKIIGMTSLYFFQSVTTQNVTLVDISDNYALGEGSLIWMIEGSVLNIEYNIRSVDLKIGSSNLKDSGLTTIKVSGNIIAGSFSLQGYGSKGKALAIPYTYKIVLEEGARLQILNDYIYKLMPGAILEIKDKAQIDIFEGGALYVYDSLIQGAKNSKVYPNADQLEANGFAKSAMFIVDGVLNIYGTFAGIIQALSNTGVVTTGTTAILKDVIIKEGSAGYYSDDRAEFKMDARINTLRGMISLEQDKSYKAFKEEGVDTTFVLESFSMISASQIAESNLTITLNQEMKGIFLLYDTEKQKYIVDIELYIGEEKVGVIVTVGEKNYITNEFGKFYITTYYGDNLYYFSFDKEIVFEKFFTVTHEYSYTLEKIIKSVEQHSENIYTREYDVQDVITQDFVLKAVISYYDGTSETVNLTYDSTLDFYVNQVTLKSNAFTQEFNEVLYVNPSSFAQYEAELEKLKDETLNIVDIAGSAYQIYNSLLAGLGEGIQRPEEDISYVKNKYDVTLDYLGIYTNMRVDTLTYGDTNAQLVLTRIDDQEDSSKNSNEIIYSVGSDGVTAIVFYLASYGEREYQLSCDVASILSANLTVTIDGKTSTYGEAIVELTSTEVGLVNDDLASNVYTLSKDDGDTVGLYSINLTKIHPGYVITYNEEVKYEITKRDIEITVSDHADLMSSSAEVGSSIVFVTDFTNTIHVPILTYNVYNAEQEIVATINESNQLSSTLEVGVYTIEAITTDINYNVTTSIKGTLEVVENNKYYTVTVNYFNGDNQEITNYTYDGQEVRVEVTVQITETEEEVEDFTVEVTGQATQILDAGVYSVSVKVEDLEYNGISTFTVDKRELSLIWGEITTFIYSGENVAPSITFDNYYVMDDVSVSVIGEQKDYSEESYIAQAILGGNDKDNYKLPEDSTIEFSIAKREITVTVENKTSVYGNSLMPFTAIVTDKVDSDADNTIFKLVAEGELVNVGSYNITVENINANYEIIPVNEENAYTITERNVTIMADAVEVVYGENEKELTAKIQGLDLAVGDTIDEVVTITRAPGIIVGEYDIIVNGINDNYIVTPISAKYKIKEIHIVVTLPDSSSEYGDELEYPSLSYEGDLAYEEELDSVVSVDYSHVDKMIVADYNIVVETISKNYIVTVIYTNITHSTYRVEKRNASIVSSAIKNLESGDGEEAVKWDDVVNNITFTTIGLLEDEKEAFEDGISLDVYVDGVKLTESNIMTTIKAGEHDIKITYVSDNRYNITITEGKLTITRPHVHTQVDVTTYIYTGEEIKAFNYVDNIVGYLPSATEETFKATYYLKTDVNKENPVELKDAGVYTMKIEIIHDEAYIWRDGAKKEYEIIINQKDISTSIVINNAEDGGYRLTTDTSEVFVSLNSYVVNLNETLLLEGVTANDVQNEGKYTYSVEVNDKNYCGEVEITFDVYLPATELIENIRQSYGDTVLLTGIEKQIAFLAIDQLITAMTEGERRQFEDSLYYLDVSQELSTQKTLVEQYIDAQIESINNEMNEIKINHKLVNDLKEILANVREDNGLNLVDKSELQTAMSSANQLIIDIRNAEVDAIIQEFISKCDSLTNDKSLAKLKEIRTLNNALTSEERSARRESNEQFNSAYTLYGQAWEEKTIVMTSGYNHSTQVYNMIIVVSAAVLATVGAVAIMLMKKPL